MLSEQISLVAWQHLLLHYSVLSYRVRGYAKAKSGGFEMFRFVATLMP